MQGDIEFPKANTALGWEEGVGRTLGLRGVSTRDTQLAARGSNGGLSISALLAGPQISCSCYSPDPGGGNTSRAGPGMRSRQECRVCGCECGKESRRKHAIMLTCSLSQFSDQGSPVLDLEQHLETLGLSQLVGEGCDWRPDGEAILPSYCAQDSLSHPNSRAQSTASVVVPSSENSAPSLCGHRGGEVSLSFSLSCFPKRNG